MTASVTALPRVAARDVPALTAAQMADADRIAIDELGVPIEALMESAARQTAAATRAVLGETDGQLVAAIVGTGNNAGDALAALRVLVGWGAEVDAYLSGPADHLRPLARRQYDVLSRLGVPLYDATTLADAFIAHRIRGRHAVLDGLLGYSMRGAPRDDVARLIRLINEARGPTVIAVDLPSGLDPDDGARPGDVVRAHATVTLGVPKRGLLAASDVVGDLLLADIGIPPKAYMGAGVDTSTLFTAGDLLRVVS